MDWNKAEKYLKEMIEEYNNIELAGYFALTLSIYPLKKRFDNGKRAQKLYDEIMEIR